MADTSIVLDMIRDKRITRITVRLEEPLKEIAASMIARREATDISDYVRGLLIADAIAEGRNLKGIDLPGWLIGERVEVKSKDARSEVAPSVPAKKSKAG